MRTSWLPVVDWTDPFPPSQFQWTCPFRWKTKSGFCACAITFKMQSTFDYVYCTRTDIMDQSYIIWSVVPRQNQEVLVKCVVREHYI